MEEWKKVNVLGTNYSIIQETKEERGKLSEVTDYDGCCDFTSKKIYVSDISEDNGYMWDDNITRFKHIVRHELVHAFLFESGLTTSSDWAENEEIVDWIALQLPKMSKLFEEIGVI